MARSKPVTEEEIRDLASRSSNLMGEIADLTHRLTGSGGGDIPNPLPHASTFACLGRNSSDLAVHLLATHRMNEQKREIDRLTNQTR